MKLLNSVNADVANPIARLQPGKYKHLFIVVEGTCGATAINLSDINQSYVSVIKNGIPLIGNVNLINLMHIANQFGGRVEFSSTASSNFFLIVPIMCYDPASPDNVLLVREIDNVSVQIQWGGNFNANMASGTLNIYGEVSDGNQNYHVLMAQYTYANSTGFKEKLSGENFSRLYIRGMDDTDISRIQVVVDGELVHDASRIATLYKSNWENNVEDATALGPANVTNNVFAQIPLVANGHLSEMLSDSVELSMIIGPGGASPEVIVQCIDFTPDEQAISMASAQSNVTQKLTKKLRAGNTKAVNVVQRIQATPLDVSSVGK